MAIARISPAQFTITIDPAIYTVAQVPVKGIKSARFFVLNEEGNPLAGPGALAWAAEWAADAQDRTLKAELLEAVEHHFSATPAA